MNLSRIVPTTLLAWGALAPVFAQEPLGSIPVRLIAGKLVVSCDVSSPSRRIPVNLFVEYDTPSGLQLHNKAAFPLGVETSDGRSIPLTLHFPGFEVRVPKREHGDEPLLEDFTKYHSAELGENAVVGVIGAEVFEGYHITFDLASGAIELATAGERDGQDAERIEGTTVVPITIHNDMVWFPVQVGDDAKPGALALGTSRYDTIIDSWLAEDLGAPAGDVGPMKVATIDLAGFVALRPEEVVLVHPDGVAGTVGINVLEHFRVEVDRVNRWARFTQTRPADFPEEDVVFFQAMVDEDPDAVENFLDDNPGARLAHEAAELLVLLRLDEVADEKVVGRAIRWVHDTIVEDLRATRCLDLMRQLSDEGHAGYAIVSGELGVESGRKDRYPNAVHEIHGELGDLLLDRGEGRRAWKHLLSAAFGIPDDGMVNLNLGRYYEQEGRHRRAFSRYIQAVIQPESGPQALEALARVQEDMPGEQSFSVDLVERMIAGKVRNFGAATKFKPDDENTSNRVVLVEFFTNAHVGNDVGGAIGGALGNQGLLSHFEPEHVAFLSYHLPAPALDPMINPVSQHMAAELGVGPPVVHHIDGVHRGPGAARWRQAEAVYNRNKEIVLRELQRPTSYDIDLDATIEGDVVSGTFFASGPSSPSIRAHVVLAEKGVLFPGKSTVVVHRMVARAAMFDSVEGIPFDSEDDALEVDFSRSLRLIAVENMLHLSELEKQGAGSVHRVSMKIDPEQVVLVAFLRDTATGEVLQAIQVEPDRVGEDARVTPGAGAATTEGGSK